MAGRLIEVQGSGDFEAGPGSVDGDGVAVCVDCADHDEAYALALAYFPAIVAGIPRGPIAIKDQSGGVFTASCKYKSGTPTEAPTDAGAPPASGGREPAGGTDPGDELGRDVSFNATLGTRKIYRSLETRYKVAKTGDTAPDFGGLIGVGLDGKIEGCEAFVPNCDITITKRFEYLSIGWFYTVISNLATTNDEPWLGMDADEVLFKGLDGNYKDGDPMPWTVTGHFGFSRNLVLGESIDEESGIDPLVVGELEIPEVRGWEHLWIRYAKAINEDIVHNGETIDVLVEYPRYAYVERIYRRSSFGDLMLDS